MFKDKVYKVVKSIPKGETLSYKDVAEKAGSPRVWRSVGSILSNGEIGDYNYNRGANKKLSILNYEKKKN